ncbi:Acetyl esterase/lipase [Parafrankia irregularis]|uniref:Acetyl esterase/lipase n=1 Tax=Parafrankia irregularis TaxID=795642 RepID=A0A0S4QNR6_9ACTN|nr:MULTISPECIES: alpha/beta hydrolase [Parafrankia]MBE3201406.1 alpha/beta hydrolase [Parafrankia sp. CH37]CUU56134.1 Acetyl esterase/lipase [Parafrankia irregularis]
MTSGVVAPQLRAGLRRSPRVRVDRAWVRGLVRLAIRRMPTVATTGVTVETVSVAGHDARLYRPDVRHSGAALLWIHGGGMIMGSAVQDDRQCGQTALELGIVVLSVNYRLAPAFPFPAALDDCQAGWEWLVRQAGELGVDPSRVAIGGQSAGGGLAACLVQRLCDTDGPAPAAQWLHAPMLDDRTAARRELDAARHPVWDNRLNRFGWRSYLATDPGAPALPEFAVAARRADLRGLPPAWVGVGDVDLFLDENRDYAQRLSAAEVPTTFHVVPGAPHGFETWAPDTDLSRAYLAAARDWLRHVLGEEA